MSKSDKESLGVGVSRDMSRLDSIDCRGTIIPTALFVAMFVMLTSTVLLASVSYNFGLSLGSVEATEFRYLSLGAANEMLSDLNSGAIERDTYDYQDGRIIESWVELVHGSDHDVFVVARTYRQSQGKAEVVRLLATYHEHTLARVYANVADTDTSNPDPIYFNDNGGGGWSRVPDPPRMRTNAAGITEILSGEKCGTIPIVVGSPNGSLYAGYAPVLDGWEDHPEPAYFPGVPIPISMNWGDFALKTIVAGNQQGLTFGDIAPIPQVLVSNVNNVTVSKGAAFLKFDHDSGQWGTLPAPQEATFQDGEFKVDAGNYHIQGVAGPPVAYDGGLAAPCFRKGQDSIYEYHEATQDWTISTGPGPEVNGGPDILLMTADQKGTALVQTGDLRPVGIGYLLNLVLGNLTGIYANTPTSALHMRQEGEWVQIPDPPAKFFDKNGLLRDSRYSGSRGPVLGSMVGGKDGEFYVVNRPSSSSLVDTIYKYSDGAWEVVPPPPNKYFDSSGNQLEGSDLPSRLEMAIGSDGQLIVRVPSPVSGGLDGIFVQNDRDRSEYDMLPPITASDGNYEKNLSSMSVGKRRRDNGLGAYMVRATYF
jgi:hypothetical protein